MKPLTKLKITKINQLKREGVSIKQISEKEKISTASVKKYTILENAPKRKKKWKTKEVFT